MGRLLCVGTLMITLVGVQRLRAEPPCCAPPEECFLKRIAPVGGYDPYGGGLLRWWPRHCFPCDGAPDDYCRKPLPPVCWPPYPPYFSWGPPEICYPHGCCCGGCRSVH